MRSSTWLNVCGLALAINSIAGAQSIQVYSELTRIDPYGEVVTADRGENSPREILSPALPRNATSGFHLVVSGPPGTLFNLYIGQNPEHAVDITLYRERYISIGGQWIPDALEPVSLPYQCTLATDGIPGQTAQAFWMDVRAASDAEVQRIKIEPEASFPDRWVRYPMEARVVYTTAPSNLARPTIALPLIPQPADYAARRVLKQKFCEGSAKLPPGDPTLSVRAMIARGAVQDIAMASALTADAMWSLIGAPDHAKWCHGETPAPQGPEWYLRLRDRIVGANR